MALIAVFTQEKDGRYSVSVPALLGCFSQGDTFEEAQKNIQEAIELYLEDEDREDILSTKQIFTSIDIPIRQI